MANSDDAGVDASRARSVLDFSSNGTVQGCGAAVVDFYDGRHELHFFWDQASWMLSTAVLNTFYVTWVTHDVYPGERRMLLSTQVRIFHRWAESAGRMQCSLTRVVSS